MDAAVLYADIMLPLDGMGVPFRIEPEVGPIIDRPVRSTRDIARLRVIDADDATPYLFETIRALRRSLPHDVALIGFAGAPFTLASYLIAGMPTRDHAQAKAMLIGHPDVWDRLMRTLAEVVARYLVAQIQAGVDVVQLFDSWAGILSPDDYERSVLPHTLRVFPGPESEGYPEVNAQRHIDAAELGRSHSNHGIGVRFGAHRFAQHMRIAVKQPSPGVVADHRRWFIFPIEPAAKHRSRTQHGGVVG